MPQSEGYVFLNEGNTNVYNSTTEPTNKSLSVLETVKKAIGSAVGTHESLLNSNETKITIQPMRNLR
jgi:hypothetical protein